MGIDEHYRNIAEYRMTDNLFAGLPESLPEELIETIAESDHVRIERIVSTGHMSPIDHWYDQDEDEWVIVLRGEAKLLLAEGHKLDHLLPGDHLLIPAHQKHRVEWTKPDEPTVWLAVFIVR